MDEDRHWIRTVGAPTPGDPRDGELHEIDGDLPQYFDLEPWDGQPGAKEARYVRAERPPIMDDEGREVWRYEYQPSPRT